MDTRKAWKSLRNGDKITTKELRAMAAEIEAAVPFLENHSQMGAALRAALQDQVTIREYLRARGSKPIDLGNKTAEEGCDRCDCGCKYWEKDICIDCGAKHDPEKYKEAV